MEISVLWTLVVFVGGALVLGGVMFWAMRNNKTSRRQLQETERATRELYDGDPVDRTKV